MIGTSMRRAAWAATAVGLVLAAGASASFAQQPAAAPAAAPAALPAALAAYDKAGPAKTIKVAEGPNCTIFRPETLAARTPIVLWSNGRDQAPEKYGVMLDQLASQGFVVAATNAPRSGAGVEPLACLDWLTTQNTAAGSPYMGKLDLTKVGAAGHSMGGGGTIMAGKDARIKATAPIQPYTAPGLGFVAGAQGSQNGPMLVLSGGADTTAAPDTHQKPVFEGANVPVVWATLAGANHGVPATGDSSQYRPAVIAWFRYTLMGDQTAGRAFTGAGCGLCSAAGWTVQKKGL
jgi:predicted dienelactone hydrolase